MFSECEVITSGISLNDIDIFGKNIDIFIQLYIVKKGYA
tara:strand:- start:4159 stop:4275 length:117 start_codon:yes stop_codon:yes gene_type:complete